jgi:quinol---cytochrome c reductase iron-sulfur subunit, bacillus type
MMDRRRFLSRLSVGLSAAIAALVGVPILGYLLAPLVRAGPDEYVDVGAADQFHDTTLVRFRDVSPLPWAGQLADTALWVRRRATSGDQQFQVFSVHCTHLGCPVNWRQDAGIFLCPCHGGVFYADGRVAGGPPERPLFERDWRVVDGRLQVRTAPLPTVKTKGA